MIVYKTTNLINGKIYIGKDSRNNPKYLGSGKIIKFAIKKYGEVNFKKEILECCQTTNELNDREKYWIEKLNSKEKSIGYNITDGGDGCDTSMFITYKCGPENANYGKPVSQKVRDAVALANKQRPKTYGESNKSYKKINDNIKQLILQLSSEGFGRDENSRKNN